MFTSKYVPKNGFHIIFYFSATYYVNGVCTLKNETFTIGALMFIAIRYRNEIIFKSFREKRDYPTYCHNLHAK